MKVICDRAALVDAVNTVSGIVASRTPTPVLKCLKLTASNADPAGLILTATDLEVGLRLGVAEVDVIEEGEAAIPAEKLSQIARACNDPTLTIETEEHAVHIRGAGSHFKVFGYDPKEFPPVRDFTDTTVDCEINGRVLQRLITRTLFAAAVEHSRYAINGVLFARTGNQLRLVATDGRRLAIAAGDRDLGLRRLQPGQAVGEFLDLATPRRGLGHPSRGLDDVGEKRHGFLLQKKQRRTDRSPILCGAFASCLPRGRGSLRISCRFSGNEESRLDSFAFLY